MSITPVSHGVTLPQPKAATPQAKSNRLAPDGDPAAVEAAENIKTRLAESQNGGFSKKA